MADRDGLENPLGPARGIWNALLYSTVLWALIIWGAYVLMHLP